MGGGFKNSDYDLDDFMETSLSDDDDFFETSPFNDENRSFCEQLIDEAIETPGIPQKNYRVLNQIDLMQRMKDGIAELSTVLSVSKNEASILLRNYSWSVSKVTDVWFDDENQVREKVGFLGKTGEEKQGIEIEIRCGICFESCSGDEMKWICCGHSFCKNCLSVYITTSINNDGPGCLILRCPEPTCPAAVGQDLVDLVVGFEDRNKYEKFLIESYVENNRKLKWCSGVNCVNAVEIHDVKGSFDVVCDCLTSFCFNCNEEGHRPVDCDTMEKWILKNNAQAENVNYILKHCKPCPNCKRPIEKDTGCMTMRCTICFHSFCWICLHSVGTHTICNWYRDKEQNNRENNAKQSREKFIHYFERWDANRESKLKAVSDYLKLEDEQFKKLSLKLEKPEAQLEFITKAWKQVIECRRTLQWSYVYGYHFPEDEPIKKQFFEYTQGEAESALEKLHHMTETGLEKFLGDESKKFDGCQLMEFYEFRRELAGLTTVTHNYFEKLLVALENGLPDVGVTDYWACDLCTAFNPSYYKQCQVCMPV